MQSNFLLLRCCNSSYCDTAERLVWNQQNSKLLWCILTKKDKTKTSETDNSQNGDEASISRATVSIEQTTKRTCSDKTNVTRGSKKRKGEFVRKYDKKYLELDFTVAPCSEQSPRLLCLVLLPNSRK